MNPSDSHGQTARLPEQGTTSLADHDAETAAGWTARFRRLLRAQLSWMTSAVVHLALLLILTFVSLPEQLKLRPQVIEIHDAEELEEFWDYVAPPLPDLPPADRELDSATAVVELAALAGPVEDEPVGYIPDADPGIPEVEPEFGQERFFGPGDLGGRIGGDGPPGNDLTDRLRRREPYEHTPHDLAVAAALRWLAAHQMPDGSWNFDHTRNTCQGRCGNAGSLVEAPRAATALALLAFLGAGQTHTEGDYQPTVKRGLSFLIRSMRLRGGAGSLEEPGGSMYSHGLGSFALCEAYGMTHDKGLLQPAQLALNHIAYAQDPVGGGWRYQPKQPGDTSLAGWQFMALKSGHMAYLAVDPKTVTGTVKFLDSVQVDSGARYGYTGPGQGAATTSIGLLCRMYAGWKHDHPALERGARWLAEQGPSPTDMYYNYYATQVLHHYSDELFAAWDKKLQPQLLETQCRQGHQEGSWYLADPHGGSKGGRLYSTALAAMILEVYYRNQPIYRHDVVEDDFQL